jgi:ankyrin repeat protein
MNAALHDATRRGDFETVIALLEAGANINDLDKYNQTPLMIAARLGHTELVRALVARGADLNATAKYRLTALMWAIVWYQKHTACILIEAGADLSSRGGKGATGFHNKTALDLAKEREQEQVIALLEQHDDSGCRERSTVVVDGKS